MTREELGEKIFEVSHLEGEFLLRSGAISNEYFDKYRFESNPTLLSAIAEHIMAILPSDFDLLAGLEMGGIPIATALSLKSGKQTVFVRKKAKEYGTCKIAEGVELESRSVIIVEDVVTSGGQIILSADDLRAEGANVLLAVCVIDREAGGKEKLSANGIKLLSLFTMSELKRMS